MDNKTIHTEIPYGKKVRHYDTTKPPLRQLGIFTGLIWLLSKIFMIGQEYKVEKIGMEGLKPPYILLSNHMYFVDFYKGSYLSGRLGSLHAKLPINSDCIDD